ncbi:6-phosphofructokinase II [Yersinia aldovae]|uniref:Phosphofructokinase n=1 Tax=Yersinia aldovae TaxID=29483 RepID=A0A0T9SWH3_YERAL|nr:6-phosphofructokinase II [Yersinia aldovae]EEP94681.1 6-phosphofructokinase isozyme 2 [Yersinia aldovae ATCC 35236]CNJ28758.1 1-phosphofructokinase [Yersinia aldovae]CNK43400.1 1-phosphofructokinase [Yersinia aldovae]CNK47593.1 1-phosphofructokinase [Yersinia aldovae]
MTQIFTLTLSPSLDSATTTPKIYPEGKLRCTAPIFEPGGGGINVARAVVYLGGQANAIFPIGGPTGEYLKELLDREGIHTETLKTQDWTRQNMHVHVNNSGEQYRFVMPGARLSDDEFDLLVLQVCNIPSGSILVISGSLPPGTAIEKLTHLVRQAQAMGLQCIIDSSGDALKASLDLGGLALVKPNQNELSTLIGRALEHPDDVRSAAMELVKRGAAERVVVSLGPQGALAVDRDNCVQIVPPPVKKMSTVGAGDSMVGAMTLKLANGADLLDIVRFGVAAGSAATLNLGTRLCSLEDTQRLYDYICKSLNHPVRG